MKFEVVVLPVADADRAKAFYLGLGWRLDADIQVDQQHGIVQFTPPGSPASIQFGTGTTTMTPGSVRDLYLVVGDIEAAFEKAAPPHNWWDWYAAYLDARQRGTSPDDAATAAGRYMAEVKHIVT